MIELRPHHLLCILGWRGQGYDAAFTENFNLVAERIRDENHIKLVKGLDAICACCPRKNDAACGFDAGPDGIDSSGAGIIDARVIERLDLRIDENYGFDALIAAITGEIKPGDLAEVCAGCEWLSRGWCAEGLLTTGAFTKPKRSLKLSASGK